MYRLWHDIAWAYFLCFSGALLKNTYMCTWIIHTYKLYTSWKFKRTVSKKNQPTTFWRDEALHNCFLFSLLCAYCRFLLLLVYISVFAYFFKVLVDLCLSRKEMILRTSSPCLCSWCTLLHSVEPGPFPHWFHWLHPFVLYSPHYQDVTIRALLLWFPHDSSCTHSLLVFNSNSLSSILIECCHPPFM